MQFWNIMSEQRYVEYHAGPVIRMCQQYSGIQKYTDVMVGR